MIIEPIPRPKCATCGVLPARHQKRDDAGTIVAFYCKACKKKHVREQLQAVRDHVRAGETEDDIRARLERQVMEGRE